MPNTVRVLGAPTDYGADRRGVDMGPSAIRYAGLAEAIRSAGMECIDGGDLSVPRAEERDADRSTVEGRAKFLPEVEDVSRRLADAVASSLADDQLPLVLGGDHSVAIGSIVGAARNADIGVVWFDAHGDFNTPETTPSGNVHGMSLAATLGRDVFDTMEWAQAPRLSEPNIALVGIRDLDPEEQDALRESDLSIYTMSDIDERGMNDVVDEALDVAAAGVDGVHVSVDLDFLDPNEAPGVGTPVRGGATYREAHTAMEAVAEGADRHDILRSIEFVEVNPILDSHNGTAELTTELVASAVGKRIL